MTTEKDDLAFDFSPEMLEKLAQGEEAIGAPRKIRSKQVGWNTEIPATEDFRDVPDDDDDFDTTAILDQLDYGSYPRLPAGNYNDSVNFCEHFLSRVKEEYDRRGIGTFECVLVFPHNRTNDAHVEQFRHSVAARISRIRAAAQGHVPQFRIVFMQWEILADGKHVLLKAARMSYDKYKEYDSRARKANAPGKAMDAKLSNLL